MRTYPDVSAHVGRNGNEEFVIPRTLGIHPQLVAFRIVLRGAHSEAFLKIGSREFYALKCLYFIGSSGLIFWQACH